MSTETGHERRPRIVVGVDGSVESRAALSWAGEEAALREAELLAVLVWERPFRWFYGTAGTAFIPPESPVPEPSNIAREAEATLTGTIRAVFGDQQPANLTQLVVEGNPAAELIALSLDATMLVLGARGHGRLTGVQLGSTADKCLRLASCSVIVVRPPKAGHAG